MNGVVIVILLILLVPILFVLWHLFAFYVLDPYKKRTSFLIRLSGPRESGDGFCIEYCEKSDSIHFFGDDKKREISLPNEALWKRTMPDFVRARHSIVLERIKKRTGSFYSVVLVGDFSEGCSGFYVDDTKPILDKKRVLRFGMEEDYSMGD